MYRAMWEVSMDAVIHELIGVSADGQSYVGQRSPGSDLSATMEHLACYLPGNLALGVMHKAVPPPKADRYLQAAADLTFTCWQMYNQTATGETHAHPDISLFHCRSMFCNEQSPLQDCGMGAVN